MGKPRKNLRVRKRKTRVSSLDEWDEFKTPSSEKGIEIVSKLSLEELAQLKTSYEKSERIYLGLSSNDDLSTQGPADESPLSNAVEASPQASPINPTISTPILSLDDPREPLSRPENMELDKSSLRAQKELKESTIRAQLEHIPTSSKASNYLKIEEIKTELELDKSSFGAQLEHNTKTDDNPSPGKVQKDLNKKEQKELELNKSTIGAQLEHTAEMNDRSSSEKIQKNNIKEQKELELNKSTIGAQLEHTAEMNDRPSSEKIQKNNIEEQKELELNKSTIRAQLEHKEILCLKSEAKSSDLLEETKYTKATGNKSSIRAHSESNKSTIRAQKELTGSPNRVQMESNKSTDKSTDWSSIGVHTLRSDFELLVGRERSLVLFIFENCFTNASYISTPITNQTISERLGIAKSSVKTIIKRVVDKRFVARAQSKRGQGGWIKFAIGELLYQKLLVERERSYVNIGAQKELNRSTDKSTDWSTNASSKLEEDKLISNLTNNDIYEDYTSIDLSEVESLGITQKQLRDIRNQKLELTKTQLEELIEKFAQYANNPGNKVYRPAGLFVKMAQELATGEDPLPHLDSSNDNEMKALKQRLLAEKSQREADKKEIQDLVFDKWWDEAGREGRTALVDDGFAKGEIYRNSVRTKWIEEIWPTMPESDFFAKK